MNSSRSLIIKIKKRNVIAFSAKTKNFSLFRKLRKQKVEKILWWVGG
jgi:hypothetical protein